MISKPPFLLPVAGAPLQLDSEVVSLAQVEFGSTQVGTIVRKRTERETPANNSLSATVLLRRVLVSKHDKSVTRWNQGQEAIR